VIHCEEQKVTYYVYLLPGRTVTSVQPCTLPWAFSIKVCILICSCVSGKVWKPLFKCWEAIKHDQKASSTVKLGFQEENVEKNSMEVSASWALGNVCRRTGRGSGSGGPCEGGTDRIQCWVDLGLQGERLGLSDLSGSGLDIWIACKEALWCGVKDVGFVTSGFEAHF
jgi:hypothetical protein